MQAAVGIEQLAHRVFPAAGPYVRDPRRLRHYHDLLTPYGVQLDERLLLRGGRNSYRAMSAALVDRLDDLPAALDLVVLAHATPDFDPSGSAASHLASVCPGEARAFALSDHGVGAPFAALRVIGAHLRTPEFGNALLVVLEQTSLPNYDERVHARPLEDSAVALLLGPAGESRVAGVARYDEIGPEAAAHAVERLLEKQPPGTLVLAGPQLELQGPGRGFALHRASASHLCTAVWVALSEHLAEWRERYRRVLVADHDRALGQLHMAAIAT